MPPPSVVLRTKQAVHKSSSDEFKLSGFFVGTIIRRVLGRRRGTTPLTHPSYVRCLAENQPRHSNSMGCASSKPEAVETLEPTTSKLGRTADATEATAKFICDGQLQAPDP